MPTDVGLFLLVGHGQSKLHSPNALSNQKNTKPGYGLTILEVLELEDNTGISLRLCGEFNKQNREVTKIVVLDSTSFVLSYGDGTIAIYYMDNLNALKAA